ncbi:zinc finger MYM-type protein 1-like [Clytia hemisphaerica]|uniref:zinc finger MYM-type protein 1-like n=1 Tax=Clytia hemisphaerica TaxID=252671 RepID=UPI0034D5BF40
MYAPDETVTELPTPPRLIGSLLTLVAEDPRRLAALVDRMKSEQPLSESNPQEPAATNSTNITIIPNDTESTDPTKLQSQPHQPPTPLRQQLQPQQLPSSQPQNQPLPPPDISSLEKPLQPLLESFPSRIFGKDKNRKDIKRSFNSSWYKKYDWIHYDSLRDAVFCFTCLKAAHENLLTTSKAEDTFTRFGYTNWKKALEKGRGFDKHQHSEAHKESHDRFIIIPNQVVGDIGELLSQSYNKEKFENRKVLLKFFENIRFLARQSLSLRGNWNEESKSELNSNFYQLLKLRALEDPRIDEWLVRKQQKYTSPEIQNEMLKTMALEIQRSLIRDIQESEFISIMADETGDVSNSEQLATCIRWVTDELEVNEEFLGLHPLSSTDANKIFTVLKDIILRCNLDINKLRGQCYDGAAAMSGAKSGVATRFKKEIYKCLYTHCYGHALNLAVGDAIKQVTSLNETFGTAFEICKLVKKSPQRNTKLNEIREKTENDAKSIHKLCPTRWTVRGEALEAIVENHEELKELWKWSLEHVKVTEMRGRIIGVQSKMDTFDFLFGCLLGKTILKQTDNLSKTLQDPKLSAAEGQEACKDVVTALEKDRNDTSFDLFWELIEKRRQQLSIMPGKLPRVRNQPNFFHSKVKSNTEHQFKTLKDKYRKQFYDAYDYTIEGIKARFEQEDYQRYSKVQQLILKAVNGKEYQEELAFVTTFYKDDFKKSLLETQLSLLPVSLESSRKINISDVLKKFRSLSQARKTLLSEVIRVVKLLLVMPATNAISERSFSALKRVKTYLRGTMSDNRLNHLMTLHVHKDKTDELNLINVGNIFINTKDERKNIFGQLTDKDIKVKFTSKDASTQTL